MNENIFFCRSSALEIDRQLVGSVTGYSKSLNRHYDVQSMHRISFYAANAYFTSAFLIVSSILTITQSICKYLPRLSFIAILIRSALNELLRSTTMSMEIV